MSPFKGDSPWPTGTGSPAPGSSERCAGGATAFGPNRFAESAIASRTRRGESLTSKIDAPGVRRQLRKPSARSCRRWVSRVSTFLSSHAWRSVSRLILPVAIHEYAITGQKVATIM